MQQNKDAFPYCDVRKTRGSFHTKWILMSCRNNGILFRPTGVFLLRTGCLPLHVIQDIIVTKAGLPLPPDYSDVADCMEWWGASIRDQWRQKVLEFFYSSLSQKNPPGLSRSEVFGACIFQWVDCSVRDDLEPWVQNTIKLEWKCYYSSRCHIGQDFFFLAVDSMHFVKSRIDQYTANLS